MLHAESVQIYGEGGLSGHLDEGATSVDRHPISGDISIRPANRKFPVHPCCVSQEEKKLF